MRAKQRSTARYPRVARIRSKPGPHTEISPLFYLFFAKSYQIRGEITQLHQALLPGDGPYAQAGGNGGKFRPVE